MYKARANKARAFAPATIANMGPGYDIFGAAIDGLGDIVEAELIKGTEIKLINIVYSKDIPEDQHDLPLDDKNVVVAVAKFLVNYYRQQYLISTDFGINLVLHKNMRKGTGMGSSAASSVATAVAVNEVLRKQFGVGLEHNNPNMIKAVLAGEALATNKLVGHPDNVLPALVGGYTFIHTPDFASNPKSNGYIRFETDHRLYFVVVSPEGIEVNTGEARTALESSGYNTGELAKYSSRILYHYLQSRGSETNMESQFDYHLANLDQEIVSTIIPGMNNVKRDVLLNYLRGGMKVLEGIRTNNPKLLGMGILSDGIVTAVRSKFIDSYDHVKEAALASGSYGFSISGSGPAVFAIGNSKEHASKIGEAMQQAFKDTGYNSQIFVSKINNYGARIMSDAEWK